MRAWITFVMLIAAVWIGLSISGPLFNAAAEHICTVHAEENGLKLIDSSGSLAYNRYRPWTALKFSDYDCVFEDRFGDQVFLDQFDEELTRTWESRGLRLAGWVVAVSPAIAVLAAARATGLLKRDRSGAGERT